MRTVSHADTESWLSWRRGGVTASDAAVIAGHTRSPTRAELWLDKIGKGSPADPPSEAMQFGILLEDDICEMYTRKTGYVVQSQQVSAEADDTDFPMRATLDGITDNGHLIESKAVGVYASREWPEDGDWENIPARVMFQVQHQMRVADVERCDVLALIPLELRIYEVPRLGNLIGPLVELEEEFWAHVCSRTPPPYLDDRDAEPMIKAFGMADRTIGMSVEVADVVDNYEFICERIKELEADKKILRERILSAMCNSRYASLPDGRLLYCNVIEIAERVQTVKAHKQIRLSIKQPKD